jgi:ABC-type transport system involved in multi-copper enzyme maturation permease subunit
MMWLTWRQFRTQTVTAAVALAALAISLAVTGPHIAQLYADSGLPACHGRGDCGPLANDFISQLKSDTTYLLLFDLSIGLLYAVPAIIGIFWGAPLITREIEAGTFRLAWNQSVTRTRWAAVKLSLVGLAAMATAGLFSLMITWWASPIDRALGMQTSGVGGLTRLDPLLFAVRGITPIGYGAFAFALGVTCGVLIRRTVPAMAVTLAAFTAAQIVMAQVIRPNLITPVRSLTPLNPSNIDGLGISNNSVTVLTNVNRTGAWLLSNQTLTPAGHVFTGPAPAACTSSTAGFQACQASLARLHLRQLVTYQPASRFWAFQWDETAIFLALALALSAFCFWWIRTRRLS